MDIREQHISVRDTVLNVAVSGAGPPVVLLHGFPHTWQVWTPVIEALSVTHQVLAPDLRGLGASGPGRTGYDAGQIAADVIALLDSQRVDRADLVGLDLGVVPVLLAALTTPERVRRLVVMEGLAGSLPGAEDFVTGGPPWWFGFHAVPGFAEQVLAGHAVEYVDFFLRLGTRGRGVDPIARDAIARTYGAPAGLARAFEHYRALPASSDQLTTAAGARLRIPTMAIGAQPVGRALEHQLATIADDLTGHLIEDCGHIIPQDRPDALTALLVPFLR
ncbi:alpha/beta fold hydrolase [uncultured Friedmanniella sp.]|uniref:alpha/beta fold hydrolase n=1 Tax=uncultured Friedmanniella sp. TaxID=335381 RepID=UPI0035CC3449